MTNRIYNFSAGPSTLPKKVMELISNISHSDKISYLYDGNIYSRKVTTNDAKIVVDNVNEGKWTENTKKIFVISSQMGVII